MVSVAIVEDDHQTAKEIVSFIRRYGLEKNIEFDPHHFPRAEELLEGNPGVFDFILMDINLGGMDGMWAAQDLRERGYTTPLIFITSLSQYAVRGYEVDALDFIVKPATYYQLAMRLDKVFRVLSKSNGVRLTLSVNRSLCVISSKDLFYVETERHDLLYHTNRQTYRTRGSLAAVEEELLPANFLRINTCYLINMEYLAGLNASSVVMTNGDELQISRSRKKEVQSALVRFLGGRV